MARARRSFAVVPLGSAVVVALLAIAPASAAFGLSVVMAFAWCYWLEQDERRRLAAWVHLISQTCSEREAILVFGIGRRPAETGGPHRPEQPGRAAFVAHVAFPDPRGTEAAREEVGRPFIPSVDRTAWASKRSGRPCRRGFARGVATTSRRPQAKSEEPWA